MVVRNKLYRIFDRYRNSLEKKQNESGNGVTLRSYNAKNEALDFYLTNNRWPSRLSKNKTEKRLATRFENFVSKESHTYDPSFRRIVMVSGRKTNNKRRHDIAGFKKEILNFISENGYVPRHYREQKIEGEGNLRSKLDYYTNKKHDMTFLGEVYGMDKCHRSGIPSVYRPLINESLNVDKPLIRLV